VTALDDPAAIAAADPGGMLDASASLAAFARAGYSLGREAPGLPSGDEIRSIVLCGMGGSAIAGDVIAALEVDRLEIPVEVVRTPTLPAHCGPHTLVLASSYSGGTSETLALFDEAVRRGCRTIAISSGGELERRAAAAGVARLGLPTGFAMPRAAFGYLALAPLGALEAMGLGRDLRPDLDEADDALGRIVAASGPDVPPAANPAKSLALRMGERVPVIWGAEGIGAVAAARWKAQWNENAKLPAFAAALPELDHNEVVGWSAGQGRPFVLVALRHDGEHPDVASRFPLSMDIARSSGMQVEEVRASGGSPLCRLLELVLLGDLASTYVAIARGVDPSPIEAIARLKRSLAEAGRG
jgi:glucose/mannose-6-phosphate isomerase